MRYNIRPAFIALLLVCLTVAMGCLQNQKEDAGKNETTNKHTITDLLEGNERFYSQHAIHPDESMATIREVAKAQHPFAVVVCCSDSRVSPELIFDQGVGDIFVIRTAGNIIGSLEIGSIEYAAEHLGVQLIIVMGHENCGAVNAFVEGGETPGHIKDIVDSIKNEEEINEIKTFEPNRLEACVNANILHGVHQLQTQSSIIKEKLKKKELSIIAALYKLDNGKVTLLQQ